MFDSKCYDLASAFLEDEPDLFTDKKSKELARVIQDAIEDYIYDQRKNCEPREPTGFEGGFAANH